MQTNTKISILGQDWTIDESKPLNNEGGNCDPTSRIIRICKHMFSSDIKELDYAVDDMQKSKNSIIRHEVIHALGFESGLGYESFLNNEECVDWIANMYPKMKKIFRELEVED